MGKLIIASAYLGVGLLLAQSQHSLTSLQVEQLIGVLPDRGLAREIHQRGTDFRVDRLLLVHFKDLGAGAETIASLSELLPNARLVVITAPPNCDVSLNDRAAGRTDDAGRLLISELDAGKSKVRVSKNGYRDQTYEVTLTRDRTVELPATLALSAGLLSVVTNPSNASVLVSRKDAETVVTGVESCRAFPDGLWECPPAEYVVTATHEGFRSASQTARVADRVTTNVYLVLVPVRSPIEATVPNATLKTQVPQTPPQTEQSRQVWRNTIDNRIYNVRFDKEHLYISDQEDAVVADLRRRRDERTNAEKYAGRSTLGPCSGGGPMEVTVWSPNRIEGRLAHFANGANPCAKVVVGMAMAGTHREWTSIVFVREALADASTGDRLLRNAPSSLAMPKLKAAPTDTSQPEPQMTIPTRIWRGTTDNQLLTIRFDADKMFMYDAGDVPLAELSLQRDKSGKKPDKYVGRYFFQATGFCKGGGHIEVTAWSASRIEGRLERPFPGARKGNNEPDYDCSKILHAVGAAVWSRFTLVPE